MPIRRPRPPAATSSAPATPTTAPPDSDVQRSVPYHPRLTAEPYVVVVTTPTFFCGRCHNDHKRGGLARAWGGPRRGMGRPGSGAAGGLREAGGSGEADDADRVGGVGVLGV